MDWYETSKDLAGAAAAGALAGGAAAVALAHRFFGIPLDPWAWPLAPRIVISLAALAGAFVFLWVGWLTRKPDGDDKRRRGVQIDHD